MPPARPGAVRNYAHHRVDAGVGNPNHQEHGASGGGAKTENVRIKIGQKIEERQPVEVGGSIAHTVSYFFDEGELAAFCFHLLRHFDLCLRVHGISPSSPDKVSGTRHPLEEY